MLNTKPEPMTLPMTATFFACPVKDGFKAHSLDFDLVAVAPTKDEALAKLRKIVKLYIEHGIQNRWEDDILFSAPEKYWAQLTVDTLIAMGEPILIDDRPIRVFTAEMTHGCGHAATAA